MKRSVIVLGVIILLVIVAIVSAVLFSSNTKGTTSVFSSSVSYSEASQTVNQFQPNKPLSVVLNSAASIADVGLNSNCNNVFTRLDKSGNIVELRIDASELSDPVEADLTQNLIVFEATVANFCNSNNLKAIAPLKPRILNNLDLVKKRLTQDEGVCKCEN